MCGMKPYWRQKKYQILALFAILAILYFVPAWLANEIGLPIHNIQSLIQKAGWWAPVAYTLFLFIPIIIAPIPTAPFLIIGANLFGPVSATVYGLLAYIFGSTINLCIGRYFGKTILKKFSLLNKVEAVEKKIPKNFEFITIILMRLIPNPTFDIISYASGLTRITIPMFMLAVGIGSVPSVIFWNTIGASIRYIPPHMYLPGFVIVIILITIMRFYIKRSNHPAKHQIILWWRDTIQIIKDS